MPTRRTPTERQKRLGAELRKLRLAAEVSTDYAAGLLGMDRTRISNMESGTRSINPDRVRTLTSNYACSDAAYIEALVAMADGKERGWWEQYRGTLPQGLLDIAELEWHATRLLTIQTVHIPGLLQTEDYARAVFKAGLPPMSRLEIELRVNHRMERQRVVDEEMSRPYVGYVHEAALRMQFGGHKVMQAQLDQLCTLSEREHISVRVISVDCGAFPGAGHALVYAEGAVPQLDTVELDSAHGPEFTHAEAQLAKYRAHLDWMAENALTPEQSRDFIHAIARQL
ncbi:helix-turn-helix domain-containing protein [Streptantibioticus rubrisoli]|uniref:Helix-turn-helix transcriptional regulator n=1 Tax=Streptantibioticus rubrisoli TaxID=1387313 RepID=A0ABT1PG13_9ACTN|nr:helix-turn-helix transcriptional regulator [Streptantibioticus rubrisoli]MCQ4043245.1 helix-turn-helix transcriptional regulator [Streptantibioticus rubrisoli]